jgi:glutaryl-CoA dehydrogenase
MDDFFGLDTLLNDDEKLVRQSIRHFVDREVTPYVAKAFEEGEFLREWVKRLADLKVLGMTLPAQFGGVDAGSVSYGLVCQELERGDSGLRSFVSVQNALCMFPIFKFGSPDQKAYFLPKMAAGELIGCFGLTEPNSGSDPGSMTTHAKKTQGGFLLSGIKAWITNAPIADLAIVWAKTDSGKERNERQHQEDSIRGFIVERGAPGFVTAQTKHKLSMRASSTGELHFDDCFVPDSHVLADAFGLACPLQCLTQARYGIAWGATGAAAACYEIALKYAKDRVQFGKPIAATQLVQKDLVAMLSSLIRSQLLNIQLGRLKEAGQLKHHQVSLAKMTNCSEALSIARSARNLLGANGISLDYHVIRHMANLETVFTYEGTDNIHHLIVGKNITGFEAF